MSHAAGAGFLLGRGFAEAQNMLDRMEVRRQERDDYNAQESLRLEYNALVDRFNKLNGRLRGKSEAYDLVVVQRDNFIEAYEATVDDHNNLVRKFNELQLQYNQLVERFNKLSTASQEQISTLTAEVKNLDRISDKLSDELGDKSEAMEELQAQNEKHKQSLQFTQHQLKSTIKQNNGAYEASKTSVLLVKFLSTQLSIVNEVIGGLEEDVKEMLIAKLNEAYLNANATDEKENDLSAADAYQVLALLESEKVTLPKLDGLKL